MPSYGVGCSSRLAPHDVPLPCSGAIAAPSPRRSASARRRRRAPAAARPRRPAAAAPPRPWRLARQQDAIAFAQRAGARRDHLVALRQARRDFDLVAAESTCSNRRKCRLFALGRHEDALLAAEVHDGVGRHDQRVRRGCSTVKPTLAYIPGFSRNCALLISTSICAVRVAGSSTGDTRATRPMNCSPGNASTSTSAGCPARDAPQILFDDVGDQPDDADVDDRDERRIRRDPGAGVQHALADEPVHRRRDQRVGEVDLQLVETRLCLRVLRLGQIELGRRRLVARFGVVERLLRDQLALEQVARAIEVRLGELESASRWRIVAAETSDDASACLSCSRISRSSIFAIAGRG